ncbi:MAG: hypothetical protein OEZ14_12160, partial [Acidimicrobiia bacterium]|nr:hypothetical protein [Acidimicrobiia bacterium]
MGTNGERGRSRFWKRRRSGDEPADQQQLEIPLERPASADEEFLEQMRAAIEAAAPHHEPESPRDLAALADLVTYQQTGEARVPHVSVPTGAWNTLASESVARGLRRLETPGRDEALFKMALIEPTHLSAVLMTAAAALVLKTGDVAPWRH